jgi:hypothetical protein
MPSYAYTPEPWGDELASPRAGVVRSAVGMGEVRFIERAPCGFYRDAEAA